MDDREAKLPPWARETLADLRRKLRVSEDMRRDQTAQIDDYAARCGPTHMTLEPYRATDPTKAARGHVFPIQTHVRIKGRADSRRGDIDVRVTDEGFVEVSSVDGQIVVLPSGGQNVIRVATARDYEMARSRDLQIWEERISLMQAKASASRKTA